MHLGDLLCARAASAPNATEEARYRQPDVLEAAVIGVANDVWGEVVVAVVALREGATAGEGEIRRHARQTLADYKVPERVHFLPVLPKRATGKVHPKALKETLNHDAH